MREFGVAHGAGSHLETCTREPPSDILWIVSVARQCDRCALDVGAMQTLAPSGLECEQHMTKQRGEKPEPQPSNDDNSPAEFIDSPKNLPGDEDKKAPKKD